MLSTSSKKKAFQVRITKRFSDDKIKDILSEMIKERRPFPDMMKKLRGFTSIKHRSL